MRRDGVEPPQPKRAGELQSPGLANGQPTRECGVITEAEGGGFEPQGRADLHPDSNRGRSPLIGSPSRMSCNTGRRTRTCISWIWNPGLSRLS